MPKVAKKIHFPTTRLAELASRPGGMTRSDALEEASKGIQTLLGVGIETVEKALAKIEKIAYSGKGGKLDPAQMMDILREADQIVTMAATFGFAGLEEAAKSLCDIADGLLSNELHDAAPVLVHVQSMRLMAPGGAEISAEAIAHILAELAKVRTHYQFSRLSAEAPAEVGPDIEE